MCYRCVSVVVVYPSRIPACLRCNCVRFVFFMQSHTDFSRRRLEHFVTIIHTQSRKNNRICTIPIRQNDQNASIILPSLPSFISKCKLFIIKQYVILLFIIWLRFNISIAIFISFAHFYAFSAVIFMNCLGACFSCVCFVLFNSIRFVNASVCAGQPTHIRI